MKVLYHYRRYFAEGVQEIDSLDEALDQAIYDLDYNEAYAVKIEAMDGSFCYERGEFMEWNGSLDNLMRERRKTLEVHT